MTDEPRIPLQHAELVARELFALIEPTCDDIQIAGSIRRKARTVKDAEFVVIPTAMTYQVLDRLVFGGQVERAAYNGTERWGMKYRGLVYKGLRCELFFTDEGSWGYQLWLRTGPGDANKVVMQKMQASRVRCLDGSVWVADDWRLVGDKWTSETKQRVLVTDESRMFRLMGMEWIAPEARTPAVYHRYIGSARPAFEPGEAWLEINQKPKQLSLF